MNSITRYNISQKLALKKGSIESTEKYMPRLYWMNNLNFNEGLGRTGQK